MKIDNSIAPVTGANRGIGLVFIRELLAGGARKAYAGIRDPDVHEQAFAPITIVQLFLSRAPVVMPASALGLEVRRNQRTSPTAFRASAAPSTD
jgi:NAD(P)-dependent dehydrogenase (short-subunit alcohol dehydrogenase family)